MAAATAADKAAYEVKILVIGESSKLALFRASKLSASSYLPALAPFRNRQTPTQLHRLTPHRLTPHRLCSSPTRVVQFRLGAMINTPVYSHVSAYSNVQSCTTTDNPAGGSAPFHLIFHAQA